MGMRATLLGRHKGKLLIVLAVLAIVLLFSAWPATAAPDTTYYIGFTSDVHGATTNLTNWSGQARIPCRTDRNHHLTPHGLRRGLRE